MTDDPRPVSEGLAQARAELERATARGGDREPPLHDFDVEEEAASAREAFRARQWASVMPARFNWARLGDDPYASVAAELADWAAAPHGRNLCLFGPPGVGKTSAALAVCRDEFLRGRVVQFLPVVELLDALRPDAPDPHKMGELCAVDILIVDDMGSERPTEWTAERQYSLVNNRWMHERPIVVTSNGEPGDLRSKVDERLWSRLVGNDAVVLRLSGADRRRS